MAEQCDVLIIGAGPVGGLTGLLLAERGAKVIILEKESGITQSPRAISYLPQTIDSFREAGILDEIRRAGCTVNEPIAWRRADDHTTLAAIDRSYLKPGDLHYGPEYAPVLLGQPELAKIIIDKLERTDSEVRYGYSFKSMRQEGQRVIVTAEDSDKQILEFSTSFVVGADGARSSVRKALEIPYEGYTHGVTMMAINLRYEHIYDTGLSNFQFLVDPNSDPAESKFAVIVRTGAQDVWRCAYGDSPDFSDEELKARVPHKLKQILPLNPEPGQYELLQAQPYHIHQRCASTFVKGRAVLAGDAAHANNPIGGFGLNTGILDARVAADAITKALQVSTETEVEQALAQYNRARRSGFLEFTNPVSVDNMRRLREVSEEAEKDLRGEFWAAMKTPEFQRQIQLHMNKIGAGVPEIDKAGSIQFDKTPIGAKAAPKTIAPKTETVVQARPVSMTGF